MSPIGSAVLTFIGYKQTNRQAKDVDICVEEKNLLTLIRNGYSLKYLSSASQQVTEQESNLDSFFFSKPSFSCVTPQDATPTQTKNTRRIRALEDDLFIQVPTTSRKNFIIPFSLLSFGFHGSSEFTPPVQNVRQSQLLFSEK